MHVGLVSGVTPRFSAQKTAAGENSFFKKAALGAALAASALGVTGCTPQDKSYWTGSFTKLPDPPANARLQLGVSTENDGTVFINYVVWDAKDEVFKRKDIHYSTTALSPGSFSEMGGYEQKINHGEVLYGDAIVDQKAGKILLGNGNYIDGVDGKVYKENGTPLLVK